MTFIPYHDKIEVRPFKNETVIASDQKFHEMGEVVAVGRDIAMQADPFVKVGDVIIFTAHGVWETPEINGEKHYVVTLNEEFILGKVGPVAE